MIFEEFNKSFLENMLPQDISDILKALWHDAKGEWEIAHDVAQTHEGMQFYDRVHAYLHRKEGDD